MQQRYGAGFPPGAGNVALCDTRALASMVALPKIPIVI